MNSTQYIVVDDRNDILMQSDINCKKVSIHSCAKPFQALPVCMLGLDEKYNLSLSEIAIMSSSMLAQDIHVETIQGLLSKLMIQLDDLSLAPTAPCGRIAYSNWQRNKREISSIYNPCVGNHIAMFLVQRELIGSGVDYLSASSSVQKMILEIIRDFCKCGNDDIIIGIDHCGAPCYSMPLKSLALGYRCLCENELDLNEKYKTAVSKIRKSFFKFPRYIEGDGCLSTIVSRCEGLIGKTGANGTIGIGIDESHCGVAIYSPNRNWAVVAETISTVLERLGYKNRRLNRELQGVASV